MNKDKKQVSSRSKWGEEEEVVLGSLLTLTNLLDLVETNGGLVLGLLGGLPVDEPLLKVDLDVAGMGFAK